MFEQLPPENIQDRISDALYRWREIAEWPEAEATVSNVSWTPDMELAAGFGNYRVSFRYPTVNGFQEGTLGIDGHMDAPPYAVGDVFTLRYHPKHPSRYYHANELSRIERVALIVFFLAIGVGVGLIMVLLFP